MYRGPDQLLRTLKMVKLKGPGLAARAAGQLAHELIFSEWKGRAYVKQHRNPKQPRTAPQHSVRAVLTFLSSAWSQISPADQATWQELAAASNVSRFNAYQGQNLTDWSSGLYPSKTHPAARTLYWGNVDYTTVEQQGEQALWKLKLNTLVYNWAICIHEIPTAGALPTPLNLRKIVPVTDLEEHTWLSRRLQPGTYYFRVPSLSIDGRASLPGGQRQVTITA